MNRWRKLEPIHGSSQLESNAFIILVNVSITGLAGRPGSEPGLIFSGDGIVQVPIYLLGSGAKPPRILAMLDELQVLQGNENLSRLLTHYAAMGAAERDVWQDRVMELEGVSRQELVNLHGKLIAYGWIEQNTGVIPVLQPGAVRQCYRITSAGLRALRFLGAKNDVDTDGSVAAA